MNANHHHQIENAPFPPVVAASLHKIRSIATLPAVANRIMELVADDASSTEELKNVIATDPALSACILKVVNSSFYGFPKQIGTIDRAIVVLGLNAIKNISIASSLSKVFSSNLIGTEFDPRDLWLHSLAVACGAREISARSCCGSPDEVFLAGLMHDIGIMIEMQAHYQEFVKIIDIVSREDHTTFREAEQHVLGATHELFGACICREWQFPTEFEQVARFHHDPLQLPETHRSLPAIVHLADILAVQCGEGFSKTVETEEIAPEILRVLHLCESDIDEIRETLPSVIEETQYLLGAHATC